MAVYRIKENNSVYEIGWIYISNGIFGKAAALKRMIKKQKETSLKLDLIRLKNK